MSLRWLPLLGVLLLCLTACTDPRNFSFSTVEQQYFTAITPTTISTDTPNQLVRQSFMPTHDGLHRLSLLFKTPSAEATAPLTVRVRDDNEQVIYEQTLAPTTLRDLTPELLLFEPQPDSALRLYHVEIENTVGVALAADSDSLYNGRLAVNGAYQSGDLLLEWGYKPTFTVWARDGVTLVQQWGVPLLLNALLWTLPGLALLAWLRRGEGAAWSVPQLLGAAWALGGALLVLLPMVAWWVGLPLGTWAVWLLIVVSVLLLAVAWRRGQPFGQIEPMGGAAWLVLVIMGFVLISRLLAIHALNTPLWGDSVHHSLITQLLLDKNGIFEDYEPYLPLAPFTYHSGFHLLAAWFGWSVLPTQAPLSGAMATLLSGQWQNVMAVVMVGLLAEGVTRHAGRPRQAVLAGGIALVVAGLLNDMPAFYLNWGRYTQLAGQIFLPPALLWSYAAWQAQSRRRWLVATVLVVAALALTHYRVLFMYAVALPIIIGLILWQSRQHLMAALRAGAFRATVSGVATIALVLPWYWKLQESVIVQRTQVMLSTPSRQSDYIADYNAFGDITQYVPLWFLGAAIVALALLTARRHMAAWFVGGWTFALLAIANPEVLAIPGTGLVNNFMMQIALYMPLAALVGCGVAVFWEGVTRGVQQGAIGRGVAVVGAVALLAVSGVGVWQQAQIAEPRWYSFVTAADWRAATWIEANTAADSLFHVNGFFAYADSTVAGSDGGEWLPLLAGRTATVPPMIYAHEAGISESYRADVNDRYRALEAAEADPTALAATMRAEGVDYVYIGGQQGMIGKPADDVPLNPTLLSASDAFETVYTDEQVWIFRVR